MEVYTLDSLYRRERVIDQFESLIWTERYSAFGDFELSIVSNQDTRKMLAPGTRLALNQSYRVMEVETFEDKTTSDGQSILNVRGRSLENILENRIARYQMVSLTTESKFTIIDPPATAARNLFQHVCVSGALDPGDVIPFYTPGNIFPADTIPEPADIISWEFEPQTVYKAIKDLCDLYDLGFRLVRGVDTSLLYFNIYSGSNRTTDQTTLPAVIFSPELDSLENTTAFTTTATYKNVAYVFSPVGAEMVYADSVDPTVAGFERRVLFVKADDITDTDPAVATAKMIQKGKEELSKNRQLQAFDGELNQNSSYHYGVDYNLGDLVEMRNKDGVTNNMRVTEQIFVSDSEGERSYPTLAINKFITPGSWLAWDYNQEWEDLGLTEYWADA